MRSLADLKIEKEFGIQGDGKVVELPASQSGTQAKSVAPAVTKFGARTATRSHPQAPGSALAEASERDLEQRAASQPGIPPPNAASKSALPGGMDGHPARAGTLAPIN